jgi:hypothetical protein
MLRRQISGPRRDATAVEPGLGIGLCAVPLAFVVMAWWRGWRTGLAGALVVAILIALACWVLCRRPRER